MQLRDLQHLTAIITVTVQWLESHGQVKWVFIGSLTNLWVWSAGGIIFGSLTRLLPVACVGAGGEDVMRARC